MNPKIQEYWDFMKDWYYVNRTLKYLYQKSEYKPGIEEFVREGNVVYFNIMLPIGVISSKDFINNIDYFRDSTGKGIQIKPITRGVQLKVFTDNLKPYNLNLEELSFPKNMRLPLYIGKSLEYGDIYTDLAKMPYLLIAGLPGRGKSNLLHNIIANISDNTPSHIIVIDYKMSEYQCYLPDINGNLITSPEEAITIIDILNKELDRRLNLLAAHKKVDYKDLPFYLNNIVIIIDELTEMQDKNTQWKLTRLARMGRCAGFNIIGATQRPSAKTFDDFTELRGLFGATICYKVKDSINSNIVLGNDSASLLPNLPGRGIYQGEIDTEIQTPYLNPETITEIIKPKGSVFTYDNKSHNKRLKPR